MKGEKYEKTGCTFDEPLPGSGPVVRSYYYPDEEPAFPDNWSQGRAYGCLGAVALLVWLIAVLCLILAPGGLPS